MRHCLAFAACLAVAISAPAAPPAGSASWFEATIADSLRRQQHDRASDRARYLACGYVAPELTRSHEEEAAPGSDSAFSAMLERLRAVLRIQ